MTDIRSYLSAKTALLKSWQVLLVLMAVLILGVGAVGYQRISQPTPPLPPGQLPPGTTPTQPTSALIPPASTASLIYGTWEKGSTIKAINANGSNHLTIANLPSNVKDINVISNQELIYLAETNNRDHAQKVNLYNLQTGQTRTLFEAAPGFGIDDLVVSSDKKWLAVWEVKFAPRTKVLSGGDSRVYIVNAANPGSKILVLEQGNVSATNFLHYPLFFDSQNRLFLDTFGPNSGGWNRGLWVVNTDGSNLLPVPGMNDGDYSTDPILSPDGTKIVFAGYDPTASSQLISNPSSGILRPAIANPNLLQIMDLNTFQKMTLLGSANGAQYGNPVWSDSGNQVAFQRFKVFSPESSKFEGVFIYDLATAKAKQVLLTEDSQPLEILSFNQGSLVWGQTTQNTGNLGQNYQAVFDSFFVTNLSDQTTSAIAVGPALQFIDYLTKTPGETLALSVTTQVADEDSPLSLKLKTFEIKPIAKIRNPQQNDKSALPKCRDLFGKKNRKTWDRSKCSDSPLYLYPKKETLVTIRVNPPAQILYANPEYQHGWQVLAKPNGILVTTNDQTLNKISYLYSTPINTPNSPKPPTTGLVVSTHKLETTLKNYATNINLQGREITDFVSFWRGTLPNSPYYFISHFNQAQSAAMMPLEITPKPDTLLQTIMYFRPLEKPIAVKPPVFEKIPERQGFTAVDWSGIVE